MKTTLKQNIIQEFVKNPLRDPSEIAKAVGGKFDYVNAVINSYKLEVNLKLPLYIAKSKDLPDTYYLFTEIDEKMFRVKGRTIVDPTIFSEYELYFLYNEKGWF